MSEERTQYYRPVAIKPATLLIIDNRNIPFIVSLDWDMTLGREYPGADTNIRVRSMITGRRHGEFIHDDSDDSFYYIDNNSTNGTFINGVKLPPYNARGSKAYKLWDGDIIRIDRRKLNDPHPESVLIIFSRSFDPEEKWQNYRIPGMTRVTIGRDEKSMIRLQDMMASREHAYMVKDERGMFLYDCNSQNGVAVNGKQIEGGVRIFNHDVIRIANTLLIVIGDRIYYNNPGEKVGALSVHIRRKTVSYGKKTLLSDVRFNADTGDFILILGGSGAGKTTLVNAILGNNSPGSKTDGEVILGGLDLYKNFKTMKSQIGLVPQFIDLRKDDKVRQTLMDIAEIKLPSKFYSKEEKQKRVDEILHRLGIKNLENHLIRQLSGGQKKKVSVAAQLVGFQKVFICDEPDSGLDAASRVQQMGILKEIANNGKIVMVISHEPDDAVDEATGEILFTKVLVLAKSSSDNAGHLAFFGSPYDALDYFGVSRLQDIMKEINPDYEGGKGRADYYINKSLARKGGGQF